MPEAPRRCRSRQDRHRGYHDTDPELRDRESKKTYDRFLKTYRGKPATKA